MAYNHIRKELLRLSPRRGDRVDTERIPIRLEHILMTLSILV